MAKRKLTACAYALVFPGEPEDALALQERALERIWRERYADTHRWGGCVHDEGDAVELGLRSRPGGAQLWRQLGRNDLALFLSPDRAFRNASDLHRCLRDLRGRGVRAVVLSLDLDTGDAFGSRYMAIVADLGRFHHMGVMRRAARARQPKRPPPVPLRSELRAPYGFWWQKKKGKRPRLVRDSYTRKCMDLVLQWDDEHRGPREIVDCLHARGLTTRNGSRWSVNLIQRYTVAERELRKDEVAAFRAAQRLERQRWAAEDLAKRERERERERER